eukprot:TRINITY_DN19322_c0_g1_i2.p1 TRINITY_DN19322_c0_g1~~TRINITY_DN19322_c0_g1_i2.p1  ORF type:complete len:201 (+),score=4.28 TRINITY_DN19322_c0_g1_i2:76-678(+)
MVVFVRHAHHRRYERSREELKRKDAGGWTRGVKKEKEKDPRPHSAPMKVSPTPPADPVTSENYIESRLGIVKKNRRSNSASSLVGLNYVDLTQDDNAETRQRITEYIRLVGEAGESKDLKKDRRSNSLPTSLDLTGAPPVPSLTSFTEATTTSQYRPPTHPDPALPLLGNADCSDLLAAEGAPSALDDLLGMMMFEAFLS